MALRIRTLFTVAIALAIGISLSSVAGAAGPVGVYASKQATVIGKILVDSNGRTLYAFASEKKNTVKCTGGCAVKWPPLLIGAGAKPVGGPGVSKSLVGTISRPDGKLQVTYRGIALYRFSGDKKVGDVRGQGNSGVWYALAPTGALVKKAATATAGKGTGTGTGSGGSTGGGGSGGGGSPAPGGTPGTSVDCTANPTHPDCGM